MITLISLLVAINLILLGVVHDLIVELTAERKRYEEEAAWAEQHRHEADDLALQLGELRRQYAVLSWVYEGTTMLELGAAWRHGVKIGKGAGR